MQETFILRWREYFAKKILKNVEKMICKFGTQDYIIPPVHLEVCGIEKKSAKNYEKARKYE